MWRAVVRHIILLKTMEHNWIIRRRHDIFSRKLLAQRLLCILIVSPRMVLEKFIKITFRYGSAAFSCPSKYNIVRLFKIYYFMAWTPVYRIERSIAAIAGSRCYRPFFVSAWQGLLQNLRITSVMIVFDVNELPL